MSGGDNRAYKTFNALVKTGTRAKESAEFYYGEQEIKKKMIIRDDYYKFHVFDSYDAFVDYWSDTLRCSTVISSNTLSSITQSSNSSNTQSNIPGWHEVVIGNLPQRLKFDVDAKRDVIAAMPHEMFHMARLEREAFAALLGTPVTEMTIDDRMAVVLDMIITAILEELHDAYWPELNPTRADISIACSSGHVAQSSTNTQNATSSSLDTANGADSGYKYSYHLIVTPYAVANYREAQSFTSAVLARLPTPVHAVVDTQVNMNIHSLRLVGSAKDTRIKRPVCGSGTFDTGTIFTSPSFRLADYLVRPPPGARLLEEKLAPEVQEEKVESYAVSEVIREVLKLAGEDPLVGGITGYTSEVTSSNSSSMGTETGTGTVIPAFTYRTNIGELLVFSRNCPSMCALCSEVHHKDSTLMLTYVVRKDDAGNPTAVDVFERCRHKPKTFREVGRASLGEVEAAQLGSPPVGVVDQLLADVAAGKEDPRSVSRSKFEQCGSNTIYCEPQMRDLELVQVLVVKAQMGVGKTKALKKYLEDHFDSAINESNIMFVSFRITFTNAIKRNFPKFESYSDIDGEISLSRHRKLIIQVESLHRIRILSGTEHLDVLILDEVESILAQFNSGLHKNFGLAFAAFVWLVRTAHHLIIIDANVSDRTYNFISRLRSTDGGGSVKTPSPYQRSLAHIGDPMVVEKTFHFHWNRFELAERLTYLITVDYTPWLTRLYAALSAGENVVVPTNSLDDARALETCIRREFPHLVVCMYSSEMSTAEKSEHFGDVHTHWSRLNVLIYTPTCSAGVSYEQAHFSRLFALFTNHSCDVETCRQMMARVRNLEHREYYVCLRVVRFGIHSLMPTTVERIRELVFNRRECLYNSALFSKAASPKNAPPMFTYDADGRARYYDSDYFHLWLESQCLTNMSRNNFLKRFVLQLVDTGATVKSLPISAAELLAGVDLPDIGDVKRALAYERSRMISSAPDLSEADVESLGNANRAGVDLTQDQHWALKKYWLRRNYRIDRHVPLDIDFVLDYDDDSVRRIYRNLRVIGDWLRDKGSVYSALEEMRNREMTRHQYVGVALRTRQNVTMQENEEHKDLLQDDMRYVYRRHRNVMHLLAMFDFDSPFDRAGTAEIAAGLRVRECLPHIRVAEYTEDFGISKAKWNSARNIAEGAWDGDRYVGSRLKKGEMVFMSTIRKSINAVVSYWYGVIVDYVHEPAGAKYVLKSTPTSQMFWWGEQCDVDTLKPVVMETSSFPYVKECLMREFDSVTKPSIHL